MSLVHFYSTHTPYDPADEFKEMYVDPNYDGPISAFYAEYRELIERGEYEATPADEKQIRDLYYGGVSMADAMIGSVLAEIEAQGVLENTIVIVTSDHGEELGEHDLWEHNWMYQTNLRIPFIMSWPKGLPQGQRVDGIVDTIDFLPTLCDLMGLDLPNDTELPEDRRMIDGTSLVPLIRGEVDRVREHTIAENNFYRSIQNGKHKLIVRFKGLEDGGWEKLLAGEIAEPRLFNLVEDPEETRNVFATEREVAHELWLALKEWSDAMPIGDNLRILSDRDRGNELLLRETFGALGYTESGIDLKDEEDPPRKD
jgi:arylsulfatase A-like enzyme